MCSEKAWNTIKTMEKNNEWISITVKVSFGREFERNIETSRNGIILLYKEFERHLKVKNSLWF